MSPARYTVRHETLYTYGREVAHSHQQLHLTPRSFARQQCLEHAIHIDPQPAIRSEHLDAFGNRVTRVELDRPHQRLQVIAEMAVALEAPQDAPADEGEGWQRVRDELCYVAGAREAQWLEAMRFRGESPYVRIKSLFGEFAHDCLEPGSTVLEVAERLMLKVHGEFTYAPGETEIATPLLEVFHKRRGVCQDYAHLMIACLRSAGLAARYVSGYLRTRPSETAPRGADASHAWVAVFAPPFGWVEFDPTNDAIPGTGHVRLASGRDYGDVAPLRGVVQGGGEHTLRVAVHIAAAD